MHWLTGVRRINAPGSSWHHCHTYAFVDPTFFHRVHGQVSEVYERLSPIYLSPSLFMFFCRFRVISFHVHLFMNSTSFNIQGDREWRENIPSCSEADVSDGAYGYMVHNVCRCCDVVGFKPQCLVPSTVIRYLYWCRCSCNLYANGVQVRTSYKNRSAAWTHHEHRYLAPDSCASRSLLLGRTLHHRRRCRWARPVSPPYHRRTPLWSWCYV